MAAKKDSWTGKERRRSERVDAQIALKLSGPQEALPAESVTTESINVGAEGVYCHLNHFIAPLTKLQLTMVLPIRGRKGQVKNEVVNTNAVVVRCQPAGTDVGGYRIACFFTDLDDGARAVLDEYVRQHGAGE